ncbi:MAG: GIY-YIG nuclease family protein [Armatimonadota bacterium]|nr:GIY-YIG nuclease family protein [Armatimonadota bacterium]
MSITKLFERLTSVFKDRKSASPVEKILRPELELRNPGPVVYLYQAGSFYKLGRTKNVDRRDKQIKLQLPFQATLVHIIYTDDEVWLERYWQTGRRAFAA